MENEQLDKRIRFLTKLVNNGPHIRSLCVLVPLLCLIFTKNLYFCCGILIFVLVIDECFLEKYFQRKTDELCKLVQYTDKAQSVEHQFFSKNLQIVATFDNPISKQEYDKLANFEQQYDLFCKQAETSKPGKFAYRLGIIICIFIILLGCIYCIAFFTESYIMAVIEKTVYGCKVWALILCSLFLLCILFARHVMKKCENKRDEIISQIKNELKCNVRSMTDSEKRLYKQ